jgi:hypothetical protein
MRVRWLVVLMFAVLAGAAAHARRPPPLIAKLIAAAKATPVRAIDYDDERCDERTVAEWLGALTGADARRIAWTAGPCQIVGPGIDQGATWCAQATVVLARPGGPKDRPMVEVFFEDPKAGRPGRAYAFRGAMRAEDGLDMSRFRREFEYDWTSRFKPAAGAIVDCEGKDEPPA